MGRTVECSKLKQRLPGLAYAPMKGALGARIYAEISQQAWDMWVEHSTMLINELRLNPSESSQQEFLEKQLQEFLFGDGLEPPPQFVPPRPR